MAVVQAEVIQRLKAGETLVRVLPKGDTESEKPFQYLSGGGQGNRRHLSEAHASAFAGQRGTVPRCGSAGMGVG